MPFDLAGLALIIALLITSYKGFSNQPFFDGYQFNVDRILVQKDYVRLLSGGFLHLNWQHLLFNLLTLYLFNHSLEPMLGWWRVLLLFFISLGGGFLLSLYIHRNHSDYASVGASGAVCGIIFAAIALQPGMSISPLLIPIRIPGWLFGAAYLAYSIYGIKSNDTRVGHAEHLGGALSGLMLSVLLEPTILFNNTYVIIGLFLIAAVFLIYVLRNPHYLILSAAPKKKSEFYNIDHAFNAAKLDKQKELDRLLDKIATKGIDSLSSNEKKLLEELSK